MNVGIAESSGAVHEAVSHRTEPAIGRATTVVLILTKADRSAAENGGQAIR